MALTISLAGGMLVQRASYSQSMSAVAIHSWGVYLAVSYSLESTPYQVSQLIASLNGLDWKAEDDCSHYR